MTLESFYLVCFGIGLGLSVVSLLGGHLHLGHGHMGHSHAGHGGQLHLGRAPAHRVAHAGSRFGAWLSAINGLTLTAFLCWFGGAGYLLQRFTSFWAPLVLIVAILFGVFGASLVWILLFKVLLPHERVLTPEETEMGGIVARVTDQIREGGGIGEIIFSQGGSRRSAAARSEDGAPIARGTEVVVLRYERGIAYVRRWDELANNMP